MSYFVNVVGLRDGEKLDAETLNRSTFQLTERTAYLYQNLQALTSSGRFESLRVLSAPLATGDLAPVVGDFVCLNPLTLEYEKALAGVSAADVFSTSNSSYAIGLLFAIIGGTGTVVTVGKQELVTNGSGWTLSSMLESGEAFRNGPYYLSATEAGKITANPSGPSIYLGIITEDATNPGYGGYAILNPQYKDLSDAHRHRAYPLFSQPAGTQAVTGTGPTDTHSILGFTAVEAAADPGDQQPRLVVTGVWNGVVDTQYTVWLSKSALADLTPSGSVAPDTFAYYLHWASNDASEGVGVTRIWSYEVPVALGTKGLMVSLENNLTTDWDVPYAVTTDTEDKRTWVITAPTQVRGWLANKYRQTFANHVAASQGFSIELMGGPHTSTDGRSYDTLTIKCAKIYGVTYVANPTDGQTIAVGTTVYEFDNDSTITPGNTAVTIGANANASYAALVDAIVAQAVTGVDVCLNETSGELIVGVPTGITVVTTGLPAASVLSAGAGNLSITGVGFFAYDENHRSLLATPSCVTGVMYWDPQDMINGLSFMAVPYDASGAAATAPGTVAVNDYFTSDISDAANSTPFRYSMGMHSGLSQYYPPIPVQAAALVLNGIEIESYDIFPASAAYRLGPATLYWYSDLYGSVPWPRDWVSTSSTGSAAYIQNAVLHFVKASIGNSGVVTSLRPAAGSPISVRQCGTGADATVGDLELNLDLNLADDNSNLAGYQVVKSSDGQKLMRGPVVERITSDGSITITQSGSAPAGQGVVSLSVANALYGGEFEEVALQNAKQELIGMFPYIRLNGWTTGGTSNVPTAFVAKFRVDHNIDPTKKFKVIVYMTVFGETDIPWVDPGVGVTKRYAGIEFSYSVLPDFNEFNPPDAQAWNSLNKTLPGGLMTMTAPMLTAVPLGKYDPAGVVVPTYSAYDPMLIHNNPDETGGPDVDRKMAQILGDPFPVAAAMYPQPWTYDDPVVRAGNLVGIRVARANVVSGAEYTGSIGFINLRWRLVSV